MCHIRADPKRKMKKVNSLHIILHMRFYMIDVFVHMHRCWWVPKWRLNDIVKSILTCYLCSTRISMRAFDSLRFILFQFLDLQSIF